MRSPFLLTIAALAAASHGEGAVEYITSGNDFITFTNAVNEGTPYDGTTVFLTTDIDLSGVGMVPIGQYMPSGGFVGTFDGMGHRIDNLKIDSSSQIVGLFGNSESSNDNSVGGTTIRNLVIGEGSSITSSYSGSLVFVGGILGYSSSRNHPTIVENCVNMATITFSGVCKTYIGGIVGNFATESNPTIVRNCANYGDVTSYGATTYAGGIVGLGSDSSYGSSTIINNINYGTIYSKPDSFVQIAIGGIVGVVESIEIRSCVSAGAISTYEDEALTGAIVGGYIGSGSSLYNNFYSNKVGYTQTGNNYMYFTEDLTLAKDGTLLVDNLNNFVQSQSQQLSRWVMNMDNNDVVFKLGGKDYLSLSSSVILLPNLMGNYNHLFDGWYLDESKETLFNDKMITTTTTLYGTFDEVTDLKFTLTLILDGAVYDTIEGSYGEVIYLPMDVMKDGYFFMGWEYENRPVSQIQVPGCNVTLVAILECDHITTAAEFVEFANYVKSGTSYEEKTVFLGSDIDMSDVASFSPISSNFRGTFDGMGHVIRNLTIRTGSQIVGLFEDSYGSNIMNVILDENCMFTSTYSSTKNSAFTGGIVGFISNTNGPTNINNCIVMATLMVLGGSIKVYSGGVVGYIEIPYYPIEIKNCAFLGSAFLLGKNTSYFGGIVGFSSYTSVENCLFNGYSYSLGSGYCVVGGILGGESSSYSYINNCVVIENFQSSITFYYNHIVGNTLYKKGANFWQGSMKSGDDGYRFDEYLILYKDINLDYYSGYNVIDALNSYCKEHPYLELSQWIGNPEKKSVKFMINGNETMSTDSHVILTPSLAANSKYWFDGWYNEEEKKTLFEESEVQSDTELYGTYVQGNDNTYSVTLISKGEIYRVIEAEYNQIIELPKEVSMERYLFIGWTNNKGEFLEENYVMGSYNVTFYAKWMVLGIASLEDFKEFQENVKTGLYDYSFFNVTLENDIEFPDGEYQEPIGLGLPFSGTFDGQGHVIKNIHINDTESWHVGLFGTISMGTIKNVILDGSCTIESTLTSTGGSTRIGSIVGHIYARQGAITVQDCLNMGTVKYSGGSGRDAIYIGGIIGEVVGEEEVEISRCVNFGSIVPEPKAFEIYIGGIVGCSSTNVDDKKPKIINCVNNGIIRDMSSLNTFKSIGGIVSYSINTDVNFSVSYGEISVLRETKGRDQIHPIVGLTEDITFGNNYYYSSLKYKDQTGSYGFGDDFLVDGENIVEKLNKVNGSEINFGLGTFVCNDAHLFSPVDEVRTDSDGTYPIIQNHIPPLVTSNRSYLGWFSDESYTKPIISIENLTTKTTFYAGFGHRITFLDETRKLKSVLLDEGKRIDNFPNADKECHHVSRWKPTTTGLSIDKEGFYLMPNHDVEFTSVWSITKYTVTFIGNETNGTVSKEKITNCGSDISLNEFTPDEPPGIKFRGWSLKPDCAKIEPSTINVVSDITIYGCWAVITLPSSSSSSLSPSSSPQPVQLSSSSTDTKGGGHIIKEESTKSNGGAIAAGVVLGIFALAIILATVALVLLKDDVRDVNLNKADDKGKGVELI